MHINLRHLLDAPVNFLIQSQEEKFRPDFGTSGNSETTAAASLYMQFNLTNFGEIVLGGCAKVIRRGPNPKPKELST